MGGKVTPTPILGVLRISLWKTLAQDDPVAMRLTAGRELVDRREVTMRSGVTRFLSDRHEEWMRAGIARGYAVTIEPVRIKEDAAASVIARTPFMSWSE